MLSESEKAKALKAKEKEKALKAKEKEKALKAKAKEKEKALKAKAKEKALKAKAKEKEKALKAKAKEKEKAVKAKLKMKNSKRGGADNIFEPVYSEIEDEYPYILKEIRSSTLEASTFIPSIGCRTHAYNINNFKFYLQKYYEGNIQNEIYKRLLDDEEKTNAIRDIICMKFKKVGGDYEKLFYLLGEYIFCNKIKFEEGIFPHDEWDTNKISDEEWKPIDENIKYIKENYKLTKPEIETIDYIKNKLGLEFILIPDYNNLFGIPKWDNDINYADRTVTQQIVTHHIIDFLYSLHGNRKEFRSDNKFDENHANILLLHIWNYIANEIRDKTDTDKSGSMPTDAQVLEKKASAINKIRTELGTVKNDIDNDRYKDPYTHTARKYQDNTTPVMNKLKTTIDLNYLTNTITLLDVAIKHLTKEITTGIQNNE